jgi:hypothetical protein
MSYLRQKISRHLIHQQQSQCWRRKAAKALSPTTTPHVNDSFIVDLASVGINNVKDFVFLHGYYEPTLMFLYEPVGTWVGYVFPSQARQTCKNLVS